MRVDSRACRCNWYDGDSRIRRQHWRCCYNVDVRISGDLGCYYKGFVRTFNAPRFKLVLPIGFWIGQKITRDIHSNLMC